jgi:hypothetical protein
MLIWYNLGSSQVNQCVGSESDLYFSVAMLFYFGSKFVDVRGNTLGKVGGLGKEMDVMGRLTAGG